MTLAGGFLHAPLAWIPAVLFALVCVGADRRTGVRYVLDNDCLFKTCPFGRRDIDRYGNRELLYIGNELGSFCPTPLRAAPRPPVLESPRSPELSAADLERFNVALRENELKIWRVEPVGPNKP